MGLDSWNERQFTYTYTYYGDGQNYQSRVNEEIPPNERVKLEWIDLQKAMGKPAFTKSIKEYATNAKVKYDRIVADAKAELDRANAQVATATKAAKSKKGKN